MTKYIPSAISFFHSEVLHRECASVRQLLITYQMRVLELLYHLNIVELDVQVLINRFQRAFDLNVVLELYGDFVVDQGLEEAVCEMRGQLSCNSFWLTLLGLTDLKKSILRIGTRLDLRGVR